MAASEHKSLSQKGFLRQTQIIGDLKANPPIQPLLPVSRSTWLAGVKDGSFPQPVRSLAGRRVTLWRVSDIEKFLDDLASN
jgi:prophage regulatory protein